MPQLLRAATLLLLAAASWLLVAAAQSAAEQCQDEAALLQRLARRRRTGADYDCDGDGARDCGAWSFQFARCENLNECSHEFRPGDERFDDSCRCRRCRGADFVGTAFDDAALKDPEKSGKFDAVPWGTFRTWGGQVDTCAPMIMPRSSEALRSALLYARERGYKVRVAGDGQSGGGLVTDGEDSNVVVVSLGEYDGEGGWEFGLSELPDGSRRATVNAGWTLAHLYQKIRPKGYFLPTQPQGYPFSLGGVVANCIHGGTYAGGFMHTYATRLRVMSFDGSIRVVEGDEMRYWRNSFGLLGVILGVEFQLQRRDKVQMYTVRKKMSSWSAEELWKFIKEDADGDLPRDLPMSSGTQSSGHAMSGTFLVDFLSNDKRPTIAAYVQKVNESVEPGKGDRDANEVADIDLLYYKDAYNMGHDKGADGHNATAEDVAAAAAGLLPQSAEANYRRLLARTVVDPRHGRMTYGEAARRDGAPEVEILGKQYDRLFREMKVASLAKAVSMSPITNMPLSVKRARERANDGFYLTDLSDTLEASYFLEPSKAFAAMDFLRKVQIESLRSRDFVWNLPGEFRFVHVEDSAVLQPVAAGRWASVQMMAFANFARNERAWRRDFAKVEAHFVRELGAKAHIAKLWGFREREGGGAVDLFSDQFACQVYSDAQKSVFSTYRASQDPEGMFATGLGMKLLAPCA